MKGQHGNASAYGGYSSAGRAPDCGSGCRGFEPHYPPHTVAEGRSVRSGLRLTLTLGCSQVVRHGTLTPAFAGSSPAIPAMPSGQFFRIIALAADGTHINPPKAVGRLLGRPILHYFRPVESEYDPVAQLVEQRPFKAKVRGSSPRWVTR